MVNIQSKVLEYGHSGMKFTYNSSLKVKKQTGRVSVTISSLLNIQYTKICKL